MPATAMNHFTILTDQLDETVMFYGELLELEPGKRPNFKFPGAWLYAHGEAILHVALHEGIAKIEKQAGISVLVIGDVQINRTTVIKVASCDSHPHMGVGEGGAKPPVGVGHAALGRRPLRVEDDERHPDG